MILDRFIRIKISKDNTVYDNLNGDFGISVGSLNLEEILCENSFTLGEFCSNKFEVQIFGKTETREFPDVSGWDIEVYLNRTPKIISTEDDLMITTELLELLEIDTGQDKALFTGVIDSAKTDNFNMYRNIVAYDKSYTLREVDVAGWWTDFWDEKTYYTVVANPEGAPVKNGYYELINNEYVLSTDTTPIEGKTYYKFNMYDATIKEIRESLCNYVGVNYENKTLLNDTLEVPMYNYFTSVTFGTIISMLGEIQGFIPHINRNGYLQFIVLSIDNIKALSQYEKVNVSFEDYTTEQITGISIYTSSNEYSQTIGVTGNTYNIAGNIFIMSLSQNDLETACLNVLSIIQSIKYIPCSIPLVISNLDMLLGDYVSSDRGSHFILSQTLNGSLFVNQTVECKGDEHRNKYVSTKNDIIVEGKKFSVFNQTVDGFKLEVADTFRGVDGRITTLDSSIEQRANAVIITFMEENGYSTKIEASGTGVNLSSSEKDTNLQVAPDGVYIKNKQNVDIATITDKQFTTGEWVMRQSGAIFNIFKNH